MCARRCSFTFLAVGIALLMAVLLPACGPPGQLPAEATAVPVPPPNPSYPDNFVAADCQFPHLTRRDIRCGYLLVPEDRANPTHTIRLHVAIVASSAAMPAPDPVVFLNGGPGAHTLDQVEAFMRAFAPILQTRDLILFDQRGVGYSEPSLNCPEVDEICRAGVDWPHEWPQAEIDLLTGIQPATAVSNTRLDAIAACRERLVAEGINLSAYNSAASAADLDDLRQALGYEKWNLLGVSYGTRLALTAMRDFGHNGTIRAVILDSVLPPQADEYTDMVTNADRAFTLLFERCADDPACSNAYPDLESRFYRLVDSLNETPLFITVPDRPQHAIYRTPVSGDTLLCAVFDMMYRADLIGYLPQMVLQIEQGSSPILANYLSHNLHQYALMSEGMELSVQCVEELPFANTAEFQAKTASLPPQLAAFFAETVTDMVAVCDLWQVESAPALENEPVVSDIPVLLLAGEFDPVTPPIYAQETAVYLSLAHYVEFPGQAHGVAGSSACGLELATAFLNEPHKPPATGCLEQLGLRFALP
jgi:pimeloyl-ACP methyl ester carboxylesterase